MHGGYAGSSDADLLRIPYARLLQAVRIASESAAEVERGRYRLAAFIGWQVRAATGFGSTPAFGRYLHQLGLDREPITSEGVRAGRERARANVERVREAFKLGRMRKST